MNDLPMKWNLDHIVPKSQYQKLYRQTEGSIKKLAAAQKGLSPSMSGKSFGKIMKLYEKIKEDVGRLHSFASLRISTDLNSQDARYYQSKSQDIKIKQAEAVIPINQWIMGKPVGKLKPLDDKNARRLFQALPDLAYVLNYLRAGAKHSLSQEAEKLVARKRTTGADPLNELYNLISDGFEYRFAPRGKKERILGTQSEVRNYFYSTDPREREAAYRGLLRPYSDNISKLYLIYQALVKDWDADARERNHPAPVSMRNFGNQVPDKAVSTLLDVTARNAGIYHEYFRLKARLLGMKKLRRFDIYAPLEQPKSRMPFGQAVDLVLDTFERFSPVFARHAKTIFDQTHIDSHPAQGKESGAYCAMIAPRITPYILLNYTGNSSSVLTLAHELGHGIHDILASGHSISAAHTTLPLAETASTTAEMIVFERLLSQVGSDRERQAMLFERLGESFATVLRQGYFVKFEMEAHKLVSEGAKESQLSDLYFRTLKEQFGSSVELVPEFRHEWAYIPHIFKTPFYCYAYNFGELLSMALFAQYKKEGRSFVPKLEKVLAYGASQSPERILQEIGIDMCSPAFWQGSFEVVRGWLEELKRLSK
jgi:oligoendopeptidase F